MTSKFCNSRKRRKAENLDKIDAGPKWGGEGYCKLPAGSGTDHVGSGRCKLHGGASPIRNGIYSKIEREKLREMVEYFENVANPMELTSEIAAARAFLLKFINDYESVVEALLDWHTEWAITNQQPEGPPPRLPSQQKIIMLLDTISKIVKRQQDMKSENAVTRSDLYRIMMEMGRVVETHCKLEDWEKVKNDWLAIRLA